jgi:hypothetical protein
VAGTGGAQRNAATQCHGFKARLTKELVKEREERERTMRYRPLVLLLTMSGLLAFGAVSASAKGPPVINDISHAVNKTEMFTDVDPCTGDPADFTVTFSGVDHFMLFSDGTVHFAFSIRGTLVIDRLNTAAPVDATGRFLERGTGNGLLDPDTQQPIGKAQLSSTLNAVGINTADGSTFRLHSDAHVVTDQLGRSKVAFSKARCK